MILVLLFAPANAGHCVSYTTSTPEATTNPTGVEGAPAIYIFSDDTACCLFSIWIYEETNGITGAQRGDKVVDDTCHGSIRPDTIVF